MPNFLEVDIYHVLDKKMAFKSELNFLVVICTYLSRILHSLDS
jgi:hypothetical protein